MGYCRHTLRRSIPSLGSCGRQAAWNVVTINRSVSLPPSLAAPACQHKARGETSDFTQTGNLNSVKNAHGTLYSYKLQLTSDAQLLSAPGSIGARTRILEAR